MTEPPAASYWAEHAWLGGGQNPDTEHGVLITIDSGRFSSVTAGVVSPPAGAVELPGLTVPGLANGHSHAFHRALRGRVPAGRGSFWSWREQMYALAARLDPDRFHALVRATYAEMALAGVTCVGEFHYLHHGPGGQRYDDPNEMGHRILAAAAEAGIRVTLLDALYLSATVDGAPLAGVQLRFGDGDVAGWARRCGEIHGGDQVRLGAAVHSVRAVPAPALAAIAAHTDAEHTGTACTDAAGTGMAMPVHVHLAEQRAEVQACQQVHGRTPAQLLADHGLVGPSVTAVHATHLSQDDLAVLRGHGLGSVCLCPTTERDLGDGIGPARALADAGVPLCLGSDSQAVVDLWEEARAVELHERLRTEHRGHFTVDELLTAATLSGHRSLGWPDAGVIAVGARADLVTLRLDTVRLAGHDPARLAAAAVFGATAADVTDVVVDGRPIVGDGQHLLVDDVPQALAHAVEAAWR